MSEWTPFGRAGEATEEVPLARPLGRVEEGGPYGHDEVTPLGQGFVAGDLARIEVSFFRHEMNLKEVVAFFEHEDDTERAIALRGEPQETEPPSGDTKFSGVSLRATVPAEAAPGVYRFRRLEAETYGGSGCRSTRTRRRDGGAGGFWCEKNPTHLPPSNPYMLSS